MRTKPMVGRLISGMFVLFSLSGCSLLPEIPPPRFVGAVLSLDKDEVLKIDYMPCINESSYFSGRYYVLGAVGVREQCTPENSAACADTIDFVMWDVLSSSHMFSRDGLPLPQSVRYGDKIPGTTVRVPAKPLLVNTDYEVIVHITGFKGQDKNGPTFTSFADFRIEPDGKGGKKLVQRGGQSCGRH